MATNEQRTEKARRVLIETARALFGAHGYANTTTPMIADATGLTRGALYHHFNDKAGLFEAVVTDEYARIGEKIEAYASETQDPLEALIEGGDAFISAMSDPVSQRILLIDAPTVLGYERLLELDNATTTQELRYGIEAAINAGRLPDVSATALTSLMSGAYDRAVLDGMGTSEESRLAARQAIRMMWFGLSNTA